MDDGSARRVYLATVADVVRNFRTVGVRHVVFAGAVRDGDELRALQLASAIPLRVVRLDVSLEEIARRLRSDPTSGRRDDVEVAARWLSESVGVGIEDLSIVNQGPIQNVAAQIIEWLGWTR